MSDARRYDPWKDAAERLPDWHIQRLPVAPARGALVASERVILIDSSLSRAEARCTLAHEVSHLDLRHRTCRGFGPDSDRLGRRTERDADDLASRRLIEINDLADALAWSDDVTEVADQLSVDSDILQTRLAHLHPAEVAALKRATEHKGMSS